MKSEGKKLLSKALIAIAMFGAVSSPALAFAAQGERASMVAVYTAGAMATVLTLTLLVAIGLSLAYRLGLIGAQRRLFLHRQLRVGFGALFLMGAVTPFVALHFSMASLFPFIAGAGLLVAAWGWGATKIESGEFESDLA